MCQYFYYIVYCSTKFFIEEDRLKKLIYILTKLLTRKRKTKMINQRQQKVANLDNLSIWFLHSSNFTISDVQKLVFYWKLYILNLYNRKWLYKLLKAFVVNTEFMQLGSFLSLQPILATKFKKTLFLVLLSKFNCLFYFSAIKE